MGRYPHLGPFELEGPADRRRGARRAGGHRHARISRARASRTLSGGEKQRVVIAARAGPGRRRAAARRADGVARPRLSARDRGAAARAQRRARRRRWSCRRTTWTLAAGVCRELVLLREGRVLAHGADRRRPDRRAHPRALRRGRRRARCTSAPATDGRAVGARGAMTVRCRPARAHGAAVLRRPARLRRRACWRRSSAARSISLTRALRPVDSVGRQRRRADLLRRAPAARAGGGAGRRRAGRGRGGLPGAAAQSARLARSRSASRPARRSARCWPSPSALDFSALGVSAVPLASFAGSIVRHRHRLLAARASARGLSTKVLLLAGVTLNAFFSALIMFVQYLADFTANVPHACAG